jgi:hypothetical protein
MQPIRAALAIAGVLALAGCAAKSDHGLYESDPRCHDVVEAYRDWDHSHRDYQIPTKNWWCETDRR